MLGFFLAFNEFLNIFANQSFFNEYILPLTIGSFFLPGKRTLAAHCVAQRLARHVTLTLEQI